MKERSRQVLLWRYSMPFEFYILSLLKYIFSNLYEHKLCSFKNCFRIKYVEHICNKQTNKKFAEISTTIIHESKLSSILSFYSNTLGRESFKLFQLRENS